MENQNMFNQNIFNKILLLVILLLVANYLSNGTMYDIVKKYFLLLVNYCNEKLQDINEKFQGINENFQGINGKLQGTPDNREWQGRLFNGLKLNSSTTPNIVHDSDFKLNYQKNYNLKDDPDMKKLYHFLQSLVTTNNNHYELTASSSKGVNMNSNDKQDLTKHLLKSFNCGEFKFTNFVILDSIIYFENPRGKEIRPFRISSDVYINKMPIGKITLHLEMFIRLDSTFYGPFKSGFPTITRIKLVRKDKISSESSVSNNEQQIYEEENFNETDNSLIPDSIHFSTEESGPGYDESEEESE